MLRNLRHRRCLTMVELRKRLAMMAVGDSTYCTEEDLDNGFSKSTRDAKQRNFRRKVHEIVAIGSHDLPKNST